MVNRFENICIENKTDKYAVLKLIDMENILTPQEISVTKKISRIMFSKNVIKQMLELQEIAQKDGIRIAFFKGAVYANEIYEASFCRSYSDIDVIISPRNVCSFLLRCKEIGYRFLDKEIVQSDLLNMLESKSIYHFPPIVSANNSYYLPVEIHIALDISWHHLRVPLEKIVDDILDNTTDILLDKHIVWMPCLEDNIIFSMQHFSRHFLSKFVAMSYSQDRKIYHGKTLYDAVLFYLKFGRQIDYEKLIRRIKAYGFEQEITVANKVIQLLFGVNILDHWDEYLGSGSENKYWQVRMYDALLKNIETCHLLKGDHEGLYKKVIAECINENVIYNCYDEFVNNILLDEFSDGFTKRRFGTCCRQNLTPKYREACYAVAAFKWDSSFLHFKIDIYSDEVHFFCPDHPEEYGDSVSLSLYNPCFANWEKNTTCIHIIPIQCGDDCSMRFEYCGEWGDPKLRNKTISFAKEDYTIDRFENGYSITLKIRWSFLDVDLSNTDYLGLELVVNDVVPNSQSLNAVIAWSNTIANYYNPAKFGKLILENKSQLNV